MKTKDFWQGWGFYEDKLIDPDGNRYTQKSIRVSFFTKQTPEESKLLIHPGCRDCPRVH